MTLQVYKYEGTTVYVEENPHVSTVCGTQPAQPEKLICFVGKTLCSSAVDFLKTNVPPGSSPVFVLFGTFGRDMNMVHSTLLDASTAISYVIPLGLFTVVWGRKLTKEEARIRQAREAAKQAGGILDIRVEGYCMEPVIKNGDTVRVRLGAVPRKGEIGFMHGNPPVSHRIKASFSIFGWTFVLQGGDNSQPALVNVADVLGRLVNP